MQRSLSSKLIISAVATLLIISALAFAALMAVFHWSPETFLRHEQHENMDRLIEGLRFGPDGKFSGVVIMPRTKIAYDALRSDDIYRILDDQGIVLASSDGVKIPFAPQNERFTLPVAPETNFVLTNSGVALHVLTKIAMHGQQKYYVQMGRSERLQQALLGFNSTSFGAAATITVLIAMLVFVAVVWLGCNRALRPLRNASEGASRIELNNLNARLPTEEMPKELLPLIDAFNNALDRLEVGYRVQQEFLATVAHELKTPLALIRGELELGGLADRQLLLKDVDRMARQVHQLLHLAEVSDRKNFLFEEIDVAIVVSDAVEHLKRLADRVGIRVEMVLPIEILLLHADGSALFVLVKNLLENALYHSPKGSNILVILGPGQLSVRDHGSGIAAADLPFIFKRFWRGPERRDSGAGLGLAICNEIALAHDWNLSVQHDDSAGAAFIVTF